ncbi:WXG100 family type VII secretion target [Streptomyces liangshanensis]|uniref:WXG100 family type VII secretion target n=1 Tax=Streptomyces liangshanensis TaxID=2717324 RepID=A0A6G9GZ01_9ACTN|nr:WXG100 family type VII secretion target [Streptomyces liangshanensis]QIQ03513.1 hypothetical protein HA039_15290 [Streptomyces liangshanensis]
MSWSDFKVALGQLQAAVGSVNGEAGNIAGSMSSISGEFAKIGSAWQSPASMTLQEVQEWFARSSSDLHALLEDVGRRLQVAYDNYHQVETTNTGNLT